jgi:predicted ferric reductase
MTTLSPDPTRGVSPAARGDVGRRARTDAVVRVTAVALLWLGLMLVTYWWVADRGMQDLTGWATGLLSLGRISGLAASVLLLVQVLLMARVPDLERAFGQDELARLHRLVGLTSFDLMVLHVVAITWGYAAGDILRTPGTWWDLTVDYPGMLLAVAGTACLVMVVVTSVKASRRRLRYESWHLLHLYAYLGVGLALPHQLWTGQQLAGSPARTAFWWTSWALAAGAVLVWRVGKPALVNLRHRLRVESVTSEGDGIWSVRLTGRRLDRLPVEAGQFLSWRFLGGPGWTRSHPYSLSAAPDGHSLRITVQGVGDGSTDTRTLAPGTRALVEGPYGRLSARARTRPKVALIGAGVGITPLRALAEGLTYAPGDAVLVERFTHHPLFAAEVDALSRERGLQVLRLPGHRRSGDSWLGDGTPTPGTPGFAMTDDLGTPTPGTPGFAMTDDLGALRAWVPDIADRDVYVCGPQHWTELVRRTLTSAGLPDDRLHVETFAW